MGLRTLGPARSRGGDWATAGTRPGQDRSEPSAETLPAHDTQEGLGKERRQLSPHKGPTSATSQALQRVSHTGPALLLTQAPRPRPTPQPGLAPVTPASSRTS